MKDFRAYRNVRNLAGATSIEIALSAGINRSQLSMYESGSLQLSDAQVDRLRKALIVAVCQRQSKLREAAEILTKDIPQKETARCVGARSGGLESDLGDDAPDHD